MSTATEKRSTNPPAGQFRPEIREQTYLNAQMELFIQLGSLNELNPGEEFSKILKLGNALIAGDLTSLQDALAQYKSSPSMLFEHSRELKKIFADKGITVQEPSVIKYADALGRPLCVIVLPVVLEKSGRIVFVSSDKSMTSYVHEIRNMHGIVTMEPVQEDPSLLLKHISRLIRIPDQTCAPPPFTIVQ